MNYMQKPITIYTFNSKMDKNSLNYKTLAILSHKKNK